MVLTTEKNVNNKVSFEEEQRSDKQRKMPRKKKTIKSGSRQQRFHHGGVWGEASAS